MAFIREWEKLPGRTRSFSIESFENDLDSLRLALDHHSLFKYLRHPAPHTIAKHGRWRSADGLLSWQLYEGEFLSRIAVAAAPHVIWFDPFSFKTNSELWSTSTFQSLLEKCSSHRTSLYTYTASTAVRGAMLAAGWFVGPGCGTGQSPKQPLPILLLPLRNFPRSASSICDGLTDGPEVTHSFPLAIPPVKA